MVHAAKIITSFQSCAESCTQSYYTHRQFSVYDELCQNIFVALYIEHKLQSIDHHEDYPYSRPAPGASDLSEL